LTRPESSVAAVRVNPVSILVTVTEARGSGAPLASFTWPATALVVSPCAAETGFAAGPANNSTHKSISKLIRIAGAATRLDNAVI
jgi:hypothetical protein